MSHPPSKVYSLFSFFFFFQSTGCRSRQYNLGLLTSVPVSVPREQTGPQKSTCGKVEMILGTTPG